MINLRDNPDVHRFDHQAMNTTFSLRILHLDRDRALRASGACFRELDRLEGCLSRYREDSDVARINALQKGESLFIDDATYACLNLAMEAFVATGGLFDVTLGAQVEHRKQGASGDPPALRGKIELAPDRPMVICADSGRQIDLGGIGKGFGLDRMAEVLKEHQIESALLSCAGSTMLAVGRESWPVTLQREGAEVKLELCDEALSASGTGFQGAHVIRPEAGDHVYSFRRVWVVGPNAALADAFSTACLIMREEEIREFRSNANGLKHIYTEPAGC